MSAEPVNVFMLETAGELVAHFADSIIAGESAAVVGDWNTALGFFVACDGVNFLSTTEPSEHFRPLARLTVNERQFLAALTDVVPLLNVALDRVTE